MKAKEPTTKKSNKKEIHLFKVDTDDICDIIDRLKKNKDLEVNMVDGFTIRVKWQSSKYSVEEIESLCK